MLNTTLLKLNLALAFAADKAKDPTHPINTSREYRRAHRRAVGTLYTALLKGLREMSGKEFKYPDPDWASAPLARDFFTQHEHGDLIRGGYLAPKGE